MSQARAGVAVPHQLPFTAPGHVLPLFSLSSSDSGLLGQARTPSLGNQTVLAFHLWLRFRHYLP